MTYSGQISLTDCVYFLSYSVKCIPCYMLRHLMASWNSISKILNLYFLENKDSFWSRKKKFFWIPKLLLFRPKKQTSKNLADRTNILGLTVFPTTSILVHSNTRQGTRKQGFPETLAWNTNFMSGLVLLAATWKC